MKADHDARGNAVKKAILTLLSALLLCGCGQAKEPIRAITVLVESGEHYSLDESILHIEPGATAVFFIDIAPGFELTAVDYRGEYRISPERGKTKLELFLCSFPRASA